jgi:ssRNA-specific RNase YbeY (16S rRNA maturation enzyme)
MNQYNSSPAPEFEKVYDDQIISNIKYKPVTIKRIMRHVNLLNENFSHSLTHLLTHSLTHLYIYSHTYTDLYLSK